MDTEEDRILEDYIKTFQKLNVEDKQKEIIELLNENSKAMCKLLENNNLRHGDLGIINKQSDFLDKVMVYLNINRELLADYIEKKEGE